MTKKILHIAIYWLCLMLLNSCSDSTDGTAKVFKYNQTDHITSLDPAFAKSQNNIWTTHHLFEGLVRLDDQLNVIPSIADSFYISEDGLTYHFLLKADVRFHKSNCFDSIDSTRSVTAYDFEYSLRRLVDANVNSPGSWLFSDKISGPEAFRAIDSTHFQIKLEKPFLPMLGILTMQYCSVVPREVVDCLADQWAQNPIGTGPFKFKRWVENQALYLTKNEDYHSSFVGSLDGIKTSFIPDKKIAFLELLNGNLDFVSGLESSFAPNLLTTEGQLNDETKEKIGLKKAPYLNMEYLGVNIDATPADSPLRNKFFRQALNYAVDRDLMLRALRNGIGKAANAGFVPAGLPAHDPDKVKGYKFNKTKAKELIAAAGYKKVSDVPSFDLFTNKDYLDLTTFITRQWEELGLSVNIEVMESGLLRQGMRKAEIPFFRASWIADYPDGESFLCMFYSGYPAPPNYTRYSNPVYDELYERSVETTDSDKRIDLYQQMDKILVEDAPVILLFYDETALFYSKDMSGISSNAINLLKVDSLTKR